MQLYPIEISLPTTSSQTLAHSIGQNKNEMHNCLRVLTRDTCDEHQAFYSFQLSVVAPIMFGVTPEDEHYNVQYNLSR